MDIKDTKKFSLIYLLLCDHVIQDVKKKISLIGIFHNLNVKVFPAALASFVVAGSVLVKDDLTSSVKAELEIITPKNVPFTPAVPPLADINLQPKIGDAVRIFNFMFTLNGLPFKEKGNYKFRAIVNGEIVGETVLEAKTIN